MTKRPPFIDHVLLIGFGAPATPDEVDPYLDRFGREYGIPSQRLDKVRDQYRQIGNVSPYNEAVLHFYQELRWSLARHLVPTPIFLGMKNWEPFLKDVLGGVRHEGHHHGLAVILAPHRSPASYDTYVRALEAAVAELGGTPLTYEFLESWHTYPLFIEAHAEAVKDVLQKIGELAENACVIFTAHSIPERGPETLRYVNEVRESSERIARAAGSKNWKIAFQSRSGNPSESWVGPDPSEALRAAAREGTKHAIFVPVGFLCENAETRYDLDIAAKAEARALGIGYWRSAAVLEGIPIVRMFTELIQNRLGYGAALAAARSAHGAS